MAAEKGSDDVVLGEEPEYEEKLDEAPKSILLSMMKQLTTGMDLSRVTLPTFILEPRSFLEKCSDFMCHGSLILDIGTTPDPVERFLMVTRWYLSGWHFKPPGVKKPYNPILGEVFQCRWDYGGDRGSTYYVAEQVSHHPPISAFHFVNRKAGWVLNAAIKPKSKFLGNSAASILEGEGFLHVLPFGETYKITFPSYYVKGLVLGTLRMEIVGDIAISCEKTGLELALSFKNKGWIRGTNNSVEGKVKQIGSSTTLYKIEGRWDRVLNITDKKSGKTTPFFEVDAEKQRSFTPLVAEPDAQQKYFESRRVWQHVTRALRSNNTDAATEAKNKLEDGQRAGKTERTDKGLEWTPKLFSAVASPQNDPSWMVKTVEYTPFNASDPEEARYGEKLAALAAQGELAVGQGLMTELNPGGYPTG
mmetsp:Transcript_46234/g.92429  ORF Transcript_46234/g.92429 Transcript_46234/m.92429 type:complete len:419 (+) Transcript_46234:212-1468(+)|eukprot:CAMPEP_0196718282 /NCGR_PEP_ID=MMETSP1091-20130531/1519_1 /TAXON_ID=302021 /ORGANISM="Rhodomonas sp., Strain CCMP768" /LENGTH=418 /DNA_ID=CAMNT_0042058899 /DNA_START=212 /DNA_END=1468 /DNA_ORIENTATION=+